jgi:hypothetical protein
MIVVLFVLAAAQLILGVIDLARGHWASGLLLLAAGLCFGTLAARSVRATR